jgi:hypothetical protein
LLSGKVFLVAMGLVLVATADWVESAHGTTAGTPEVLLLPLLQRTDWLCTCTTAQAAQAVLVVLVVWVGSAVEALGT